MTIAARQTAQYEQLLSAFHSESEIPYIYFAIFTILYLLTPHLSCLCVRVRVRVCMHTARRGGGSLLTSVCAYKSLLFYVLCTFSVYAAWS